MAKIRTRFAPSPTGRMHVGNLRTALYAYLIAKHEDGDFIVRIEDTDQERQMEGASEIIFRTLKKTGLNYDEGPGREGDCGPYVQSERQNQGIYLEYAKQLIEKGEAYYCFCDQARLDSLRTHISDSDSDKEIVQYDKHCLHLSKEEVEEKLAAGKPYVIRQNNPTEGKTSFEDEIYGTISVDNGELDDMILIKSDGFPTYNFANVVDDHLMGITHVVRGNEYLSSAPKYNRLYEAFGWEIPHYIHCPLITNEDHQKLSKRSGHSSYEDLIDQGFLNETVINFVALLGWSPEDNQEFFTLEELVKAFDYRKISKSPAVFDMTKLRWMNGEYIKRMEDSRFKELVMPYVREVITRELDFDKLLPLVKTRIEVLPEVKEHIDFFEALPDYDVNMYVHKKMKTNLSNSLEILQEEYELLKQQEDWSFDGLKGALMDYIGKKEIKNGTGLWPVRTAVSGKQTTPGGAFEILEILGKEESLRRIEVGISKLEAVQSAG